MLNLFIVPSDVPQNISANSINATHALLVWDPPPPEHQNGIIQAYIIMITVVDINEIVQEFSMGNTTVLGPLHPFYTYKFSIAAQTIGLGPYSSPISLKMPPINRSESKMYIQNYVPHRGTEIFQCFS